MWAILALARRGEPDARFLVDVVTVDVRLAVLTDRGIEESAAVGQEVGLVVVAGARGDVDRRTDDDAAILDTQLGQVDVGRLRRGGHLQQHQRGVEHAQT